MLPALKEQWRDRIKERKLKKRMLRVRERERER